MSLKGIRKIGMATIVLVLLAPLAASAQEAEVFCQCRLGEPVLLSRHSAEDVVGERGSGRRRRPRGRRCVGSGRRRTAPRSTSTAVSEPSSGKGA